MAGYSPAAQAVHADVAQLVEHHLAKVRVAGSSPVIRSQSGIHSIPLGVVGWPRGEAAACKAVYTGSNPVPTSGDWRRGSALPSHGRGHWFDPSIAHQQVGSVSPAFCLSNSRRMSAGVFSSSPVDGVCVGHTTLRVAGRVTFRRRWCGRRTQRGAGPFGVSPLSSPGRHGDRREACEPFRSIFCFCERILRTWAPVMRTWAR